MDEEEKNQQRLIQEEKLENVDPNLSMKFKRDDFFVFPMISTRFSMCFFSDFLPAF